VPAISAGTMPENWVGRFATSSQPLGDLVGQIDVEAS